MAPERTASRKAWGIAAGLTVWALILCVGLASTEWLLRNRYLRIARSDRLTPGLTVPDPQLGWHLQPSWQGRHRHHDFDVGYAINADGFRGPDVRQHTPPAANIAVVGDSFTFGIGVGDDEVFTRIMDRRQPLARRIYNYAVPGFSTDQELLLIEQRVLATRPDTLVLVVYLANDLFDNQLTMPLQVPRTKPLFVLERAGLKLVRSSIAGFAADRVGQPTLLDMVMGSRPDQATLRQQLEGRSYLFRYLSETVLPRPPDDPAFAARYDYALRLFWALVERLQGGCAMHGTSCVVALMPGGSFVESPASLSAQFQDFFRRRIVEDSGRRQTRVIDVAEALRARYMERPGSWFHPNEGHLSVEGHRVVADILDHELKRIEGRARKTKRSPEGLRFEIPNAAGAGEG